MLVLIYVCVISLSFSTQSVCLIRPAHIYVVFTPVHHVIER